LPVHAIEDVPVDFSSESLAVKWVAIKNEVRDHVTLNESKGEMTLTLQPTLEKSFIGVRQTSWNFSTEVSIDVSTLVNGDCVGIAAYIKENFYLSLQIKKINDEAWASIMDSSESPEEVNSYKLELASVKICLDGDSQDYTFSIPSYGVSRTLDGRGISCDMTDSHTGVMIAFIGSSAHTTEVNFSDFAINFEKD
jgi:beta-xylosidase